MKNKVFTAVILLIAIVACLCNMKLEIENVKLKEEIRELKGEDL